MCAGEGEFEAWWGGVEGREADAIGRDGWQIRYATQTQTTCHSKMVGRPVRESFVQVRVGTVVSVGCGQAAALTRGRRLYVPQSKEAHAVGDARPGSWGSCMRWRAHAEGGSAAGRKRHHTTSWRQ